MDESKKIIEDMQAVVAQMVQDDIDENPDVVNEFLIALHAEKINASQEVFNTANTDCAMIVCFWLRPVLH